VKVVLAVDKFKGSASGAAVSAALGRGLSAVDPELDIVTTPVADGGDGSLDALLSAGFVPVPVTARGPLGHPRATRFGMRGEEAFVELAEVCGIDLLSAGAREPWRSGTYGLGEAIGAALDHGARRVVVGLGGSASTDGGLGMLLALGARAETSHGLASPDAIGMASTITLDLSGLDPRIADTVFVAATDVTNPLTGPDGAARVFAPQKGAGPRDVVLLADALERWATCLAVASGRSGDVPGGGAAGGVGAAIVGALGGTVTSGAALVLDLTGFDSALSGDALVITGEGSWDVQTGGGKAPSHVLERAGRAGIPVAVVAGRIAPGIDLPAHVRARIALLDLEPDPALAMTRVLELLETAGRTLARDVLPNLAVSGTGPPR
jgi:glycerate kinase